MWQNNTQHFKKTFGEIAHCRLDVLLDTHRPTPPNQPNVSKRLRQNQPHKVKVKWIYIAPSSEISKALMHGSHSVTCNYTNAYLVSVHQMALPNLRCEHLIAIFSSFIYPERMKGWVSLLGWPTGYSGRFTHISGHPSAAGRAQNRESSPVKDQRSTNATVNTQFQQEAKPSKRPRNGPRRYSSPGHPCRPTMTSANDRNHCNYVGCVPFLRYSTSKMPCSWNLG